MTVQYVVLNVEVFLVILSVARLSVVVPNVVVAECRGARTGT